MDAIDAIRSRRSTRSFLDRPVERALIAELIGDCTHAPYTPGAVDGAWAFTVIEGRKRLEDYGKVALDFARRNRPQLEGYEWTEWRDFSVFHGAPVAIVISGREDYRIALEECTRAGMILGIAAHARGLGSCWVGSPLAWLREPEVRAELRIADGWIPHAAFALGYAAGQPAMRWAAPAPQVDWLD